MIHRALPPRRARRSAVRARDRARPHGGSGREQCRDRIPRLHIGPPPIAGGTPSGAPSPTPARCTALSLRVAAAEGKSCEKKGAKCCGPVQAMGISKWVRKGDQIATGQSHRRGPPPLLTSIDDDGFRQRFRHGPHQDMCVFAHINGETCALTVPADAVVADVIEMLQLPVPA
eukprot:gene26706-16489_t